MSLIPHELSTKLVNLSKLLKQSGELTAHINRLRDQLATTGPSVLAAQRLDASYSRAIQLSWDEQNLTAACVRGLESVLRSVSSGTKRGAAAEGGTRGDSARGDACARAAAAATTAADGAGGASVCGGGAAAAKGKRARLAESEEKKRPSSPPPGAFPDAQLELVSGDAADAPLCGAVPAGADFVVPVGGRVVSRLSGPKVTPQLWAIGIVLRHIQAKGKYVLRDDDLPGAPPCCTTKQHTITAKYVVPLPTTLPAPGAVSARNVFQRGANVLAMHPAGVRFVRGTVNASPGDASGRRSYVIAFDAVELDPGAAVVAAVPPSFVVELPACLIASEDK